MIITLCIDKCFKAYYNTIEGLGDANYVVTLLRGR